MFRIVSSLCHLNVYRAFAASAFAEFTSSSFRKLPKARSSSFAYRRRRHLILKNGRANMISRFKDQMWEKVAKEMGIPWRAAEAMHWQLGEHDMAQRANAPIFHLSSSFVTVTQPSSGTSSLPVTTTSATGHLQLPTLSALPRPGPLPMMVPTSTPSVASTSALASRSRRSSNTSSRRRPDSGRSGQHGRYQQHGEGRASPSPSREHSYISGQKSRNEGSPVPHRESSYVIYESSDAPEASAPRGYRDRADTSTKAGD